MAELDDNKVLANIKKDLDIADKLQDDVINELTSYRYGYISI